MSTFLHDFIAANELCWINQPRQEENYILKTESKQKIFNSTAGPDIVVFIQNSWNTVRKLLSITSNRMLQCHVNTVYVLSLWESASQLVYKQNYFSLTNNGWCIHDLPPIRCCSLKWVSSLDMDKISIYCPSLVFLKLKSWKYCRCWKAELKKKKKYWK